MNRQILGFLGLVPLILAGCVSAPVEETDVTTALPPMSQPAVGVGHTWKGLRNGKPQTYTIVADRGDAWDWEASSGCKFTVSKSGFAPGMKWSNCTGVDGQQTSALNGEIWPLQVGKTWSFDFQGSNVKGSSWEGTRTCEVVTTVNIQTALGPTDTYKVVCRDQWNERTYYVSPQMKEFVFWEWYRKHKNQRFRHEIIAAS